MNTIREYELVIIGRPGSVSFASKTIDSARIALDALNHKIGSHAGFQHANMFEVISEDGNALSLCATFERYTPTAWRVVDDWRMKQAPIHWKSAARAFFRRAEAKKMQLDNALECLAPARDEELEEGFESWQDAARHWYEKLRRERAKSAEILRALIDAQGETKATAAEREEEHQRAKDAERFFLEIRCERDELLQKIEELTGRAEERENVHQHHYEMRMRAESELDLAQIEAGNLRSLIASIRAQPSGNPGEFAENDRNKIKIYEHEINKWDALCGNALRDYANETGCIVAGDHLGAAVAAALREVYQLRKDVAKWRELWEMERDAGNAEHKRLEAKLSAVGNLADLAERIAYADGKHPRDLPDGRHTHENVALIQLQLAREALAALPTWRNAITCEFNEAMYELARGDMDRFADELLDLCTASFRARRAVLERGKR